LKIGVGGGTIIGGGATCAHRSGSADKTASNTVATITRKRILFASPCSPASYGRYSANLPVGVMGPSPPHCTIVVENRYIVISHRPRTTKLHLFLLARTCTMTPIRTIPIKPSNSPAPILPPPALIQVNAQISARDRILSSLPSGSFLVAGNYSGSGKNGEPWFSWEPGLSLSCAREGAERFFTNRVTPRSWSQKRSGGVPDSARQSARAYSAKG
jgi:hypothetical protein